MHIIILNLLFFWELKEVSFSVSNFWNSQLQKSAYCGQNATLDGKGALKGIKEFRVLLPGSSWWGWGKGRGKRGNWKTEKELLPVHVVTGLDDGRTDYGPKCFMLKRKPIVKIHSYWLPMSKCSLLPWTPQTKISADKNNIWLNF